MRVVFTRTVQEGGIVKIDRSVVDALVAITSVSEYLVRYTLGLPNQPVGVQLIDEVYVVATVVPHHVIAYILIFVVPFVIIVSLVQIVLSDK